MIHQPKMLIDTWLVQAKDVLLKSSIARTGYFRTLSTLSSTLGTFGRERRALELWLRGARATQDSTCLPPSTCTVRRRVLEACFPRSGELGDITDNRMYADFRASRRAEEIRSRFHSYETGHAVRLREPVDEDPERQGDLIVLKAGDPRGEERGVLLVKYTEAIESFAAMYDLGEIFRDYIVVLEPSWWGYCDIVFTYYVSRGHPVIVQAPWTSDFEFVRDMRTNLEPVSFGAGDWVDPETFRASGDGKRFDVVMVSSWNPTKRHRTLFEALETLREEEGRRLDTALVGVPGRWTREDIETLAGTFGVQDQLTIFERIAPEDVARVVSESKAYVVLSRREGANKALYEALFSGTPVVAPAGHRGINAEVINEDTGVLFEEGALARALLDSLNRHEHYSPRRWAEDNTGCYVTSDKLKAAVSKLGETANEMVGKKNMPNLRYLRSGQHRRFEGEYERLEQYLL